MLEIRLLGPFEIILTDGSTPGRLGPKPQGLLALLAMSKGRRLGRGRLAGLLWGERDEDHARHSLSQALTTLRVTLGPDAILADSEGVGLTNDRLWLDIDAFESAVRVARRDTLEDALRLYRGAFLDGLEIKEAGFEEWMLSERYRLGELAADAFARLLELQTTEGDVEAAIETARRLIALTPLDETLHARLIRLYGAQGRQGLAQAHYARCTELLRRELGEAPGDELEAALADARLRSRRQPLSGMPGAGRSDPDRRHERPQPPRRRTRTRWATAAVAAATVLLISTLAWTFHCGDGGGASENGSYQAAPWDLPTRPSIAVLPFENLSGNPEQAYFADGVVTDIITDLSKFSSLLVIAPNASFRYHNSDLELADVARELGVRYLLEGSVQRADERLWVNARLIDATTGRHVWAERYERPAANLFDVQKEITQTIVGTIGSARGEIEHAELERIRRLSTTDLAAYDFYLLGTAYKKHKTKEHNALAREMFEQAIQADQNYARAIAESGLTYINDIFNGWTDSAAEWIETAEDLARRAIETDWSEPWGFVALGLVHQLKGQHGKALSLFVNAHALNPNDYYVKQALGYALTWSGSAERATELLEQARRLNPHRSGEHVRALGLAYFFSRRYRDALATIDSITRRHQTPAYWQYKAAAHAQLGELDVAHEAVTTALNLDPDLTLEGEHERRLAMGLAPAYAALLTEALRKAGLPQRAGS